MTTTTHEQRENQQGTKSSATMPSAFEAHAGESANPLEDSDSVSQLSTREAFTAQDDIFDCYARVLNLSARKSYIELSFSPYPVKAETCGLAATRVPEHDALKICEVALFHYVEASYDENWLSFILGDSLNLLNLGYGAITQQAAKMGIGRQALYDFKFVCKKIPLPKRHLSLRWSAASVIARYSPQEMIDYWIRVAIEDRPSLRDLEDRIKSCKKHKFTGESTGCKKIITLAKTITSALTAQSKVKELSPEQRRQIVAAIDKIAAMRPHFSSQLVTR